MPQPNPSETTPLVSVSDTPKGLQQALQERYAQRQLDSAQIRFETAHTATVMFVTGRKAVFTRTGARWRFAYDYT